MSGIGHPEDGNTAHYARHGSVAVITMDHPPVNALGRPLRAAIRQGLEMAKADADVKAVLLIGTNSAFSAGADIKETTVNLQQNRDDMKVPDTLDKPIIAAIGGFALGGGLELALCCHYRIATPDARLGLTEVRLGRVPGSGGTQRLPRLIGVEAACRMLLSGDTVSAPEALRIGLIDRICDGDLLAGALSYAVELIDEGRGPRRVRDLQAQVAEPDGFFAARRAELDQSVPGYQAPLRILDCIEAAVRLPFEQAKAIEEKHGDEARNSLEAQGLQYFFFAERNAAKAVGLAPDWKAGAIRRIAITGSSALARRLIDAATRAEIEVCWLHPPATRPANTLAACGIRISTDMADVAECDVLIEAAFDAWPRKHLLQALTAHETIVASCTDAMDVGGLARSLPHPHQAAGLYLPMIQQAGLAEIIVDARTSPETAAGLSTLMKRMGMTVVLTHPKTGTACHRLLQTGIAAVEMLMQIGVMETRSDHALRRWGLSRGFGQLARETLSMESALWPQVPAMIAIGPDRAGTSPGKQQEPGETDETIVARVMKALADEARKMKEQNVIARTSDADVICVAGYGIPRYRGGPVFLDDAGSRNQAIRY